MPTRTRDSYIVRGTTPQDIVASINFLFQRLADRMDRIEGIRGTASIESDLDMNSNQITEMESGVVDSDGASIDNLTQNVEEAIADHVADGDPHTQYTQNDETEVVSGTWTFEAETTFEGDIVVDDASVLVYDANGTLIHSFGSE